MGFLGKIVGGIAKGIGSVVKGVVKFAKSPLGKLVMQVGLSLVTGGVGGIAAKLLSGPLMKIAGPLLGKVAGPLAEKFLGSAGSLLSGNGIGALTGLASKAGNVGDLLGIAKSLMSGRQQAPQVDPTTNEMANQNAAQILAWRQAMQMWQQNGMRA
jgi:hypothetical protein